MSFIHSLTDCNVETLLILCSRYFPSPPAFKLLHLRLNVLEVSDNLLSSSLMLLVSHNNMKPSMKEFVKANKNMLKKFRLTGTNTIMTMFKEGFGNDPNIEYSPTFIIVHTVFTIVYLNLLHK